MTLSRDPSSSSFSIPNRDSADLCPGIATLRPQAFSAASLNLYARSQVLVSLCLCRFKHSGRCRHGQNAIQYPVGSSGSVQ